MSAQNDVREAAMKIAVMMEVHAALSTTTKAKADEIEPIIRDLHAATLARAERAEAERVCAELDAAMADGKIRHALPTRFVSVPPDGGDVKTLEAVKATVEALERAEALLAEAVEALRFYADERLDGYDVHVTDYGLSTEEGHIIEDGGERARATLARIQEARHE